MPVEPIIDRPQTFRPPCHLGDIAALRERPGGGLARIIHESRSEVPEMPAMARKTTEKTAGVFENTLRIGEGV